MPDFYVAAGTPGNKASLDSAPVRSELSAIAAAFAKLAPYTGNAGKLVRVNGAGTGYDVTSAIDGVPIGSTTPSTGAFTTLSATGMITASGGVTGALTGNASTATTLQTARTINGVSFNGSANITITANTPNALTAGSFLTSGGTFDGSAARTFAVDATSANTASKVVARDGSGNFSAGTITAALNGNASTASSATNASQLNGAVDSESNTGSTIAKRNSSGYLFSVYFNQSSSSSENPSIGSFFVETGSDGYHRKATLAHVQSQLGCALLASGPTFTGVVKGNNGGLGLGQISVTTTTGTPSGGSNGDFVLVY